MRDILLFSMCIAIFPMAQALGAKWYVDDSVLSSGDGKSPATAFEKVQEGIDAASDADAVIVAQGIYLGNIHFHGKNIVLMSTDPRNPTVVADTIIHGDGTGSVVTFSGTETEACVLSGFTIRNGDTDFGGGIRGNAGAGPTHATIENNTITRNSGEVGGGLADCDGTIQNNTIVDNSAQAYGGGLYSCNGTIQNNVITGNSATFGGGLYGCDGMIQTNTMMHNSAQEDGGGLAYCHGTIENNTITSNSARYGGGGLAYCHGTIQNNTITSNSARYSGGLAYCSGTIRNNTVSRNWADYGGGMASCDGTVQDNTINDNLAYQNGGGLYKCAMLVVDNTITGNWAQQRGGGLGDCDGTIQGNTITGNVAQTAGGLDACDGTIQSNRISSNRAMTDGGGLSYCLGTVQSNTITGNSALNGGGLYDCHGTVQNNTITGNSAQVYGGGLAACGAAIRNNTIADNSATQGGGGLSYCTATMRNCILWGNTAPGAGQLHESSVPTYSCIEGWTGDPNTRNIAEHPQFVDPDGPDNDPGTQEDNNYRSSASSPCVDAGLNEDWMGSATDLDGNPRIVDGDGDAQAIVDMGAYEYSFKFRISQLLRQAGGAVRLTWTSRPGATYTVWSCTDLSGGQWTDEAGLPSQGESTTWSDLSAGGSRRFYRVEQF